MSKELSSLEAEGALGRIRLFYDLEIDEYFYLKDHNFEDDLDIIEKVLKKIDILSNQLEHERKIRIRQEKKLKALEVIKEKVSPLLEFTVIKKAEDKDNTYYTINNNWDDTLYLTQEEFDLVREILL